MAQRLDDIDWTALLTGPFHPSPHSWADQVLYFLLLDRFSDGTEAGYLDLSGQPVAGSTPPFRPEDDANAVQDEPSAQHWRDAGRSWVGGTLRGLRSKLGYLRRLGVTALWVSPVLRQRPGTPDYHGYGTQDFLQVDPHFGTEEDLVALVREAHENGLRVILDVVLNHSGDVFGYRDDRPWDIDDQGFYQGPRWNGSTFPVSGWRDETGAPVLPFPGRVGNRPDSAIWPAELQADGVFTCRGRIVDWDADPQYRDGDFLTYKDIRHGQGGLDNYQPSAALQALVTVYKYWIARADLDGMRIDTVKHMDPGAVRYLASALHEFAAQVGKSTFFLVGEITGPRGFAIELMEQTGLDAALGLADVQTKLDEVVRGWRDPVEYFELFRHAEEFGRASHTWLADRVVTSIDDHDQVRKPLRAKARFAASPEGHSLAAAALAMNVTTLGIPCVYYGSEQCFDGAGGHDRFIREAMFGGAFGAFRSTGRHCFDEDHPVYRQLAAVLAVRGRLPALRVGRQYLRPISGDGQNFGLPHRLGDRMTSIVGWSRILGDAEVLCALNTDTSVPRTAWVTVDAALQANAAAFEFLYHPEPGAVGHRVPVESRNGRAVSVQIPPAGFVILAPR